MSNTHSNRSHSDVLGDILERLHGAVAKATKLRHFLGDLEAELNQICQECENEIYAHTVAVAATDKGQDVHTRMAARPDSVSLQDLKWNRDPILAGREKGRNVREQEGDRRTERPRFEPNPDPKSKQISEPKGRPPPSIPSDSSLSVFSGGSKLLAAGATTALRSRSGTAETPRRTERPSVPQPPTSPFPDDIDLSAYPPELKREGPDWFVLFNPSQKVKRVLDINLMHTLEGSSKVFCVRFSQDGKWLATGCVGSARVYDVKTGVRKCILNYESDIDVWSVCFSPDGQYLATGAQDKRVRVWNIAKKQNDVDHILEGHQGAVFSICFSPNGRFIVSGSGDRTVRVWDVLDWTFRVLTIDDHYSSHDSQGLNSVAISPDGRYVAAGGNDNVVTIWEMKTGVLLQRLRGHQNVVLSVAFTPDGKGLISGSLDQILKYWDSSSLGAGTALTGNSCTSSIPSSPCLMNLSGYNLYSASVSHDGVWVVSASTDGTVPFWDMRTGVIQCMLSQQGETIHEVDLNPSGKLLATASWNGEVRIWKYGVFED